MSLFQCQVCGCAENTACASQGFIGYFEKLFDWSYAPERKGLRLCSVCGPIKYSKGEDTEYGKWHNRFPRHFLPKDEFFTNGQGNLEHLATGSTDITDMAYNKFALAARPERDIFGEIVTQGRFPDSDDIKFPPALIVRFLPALLSLRTLTEKVEGKIFTVFMRRVDGKYRFSISSEEGDSFMISVSPQDERLYTTDLKYLIQYFHRFIKN